MGWPWLLSWRGLPQVVSGHEQLEQSDEEQPEQEEPDFPEDLNLFPAEKPKEDMFFFGFFAPQAGHRGLSSPNTMTSNSLPHFLQVYS